MIEVTCIHCGKKVLAKKAFAMYCNASCRNKHRWSRIKQGLVPYERSFALPECPYNEGVNCGVQKCRACGWNPAVAEKRMEALHG
jgi:hypothetical protein